MDFPNADNTGQNSLLRRRTGTWASPASNPERSSKSTRRGARLSRAGGESPERSVMSMGSVDVSVIDSSGNLASSAENCFNYTSSCFLPSILALFSFGLLCFMISAYLPTMVACSLTMVMAVVLWEWYNLYGSRLSRIEHIIFDVSNILATSENFDFNKGAIYDPNDPPTPGRPELSLKKEEQ